MKTISELNSRWYWRLIKVAFGVFIFGVSLGLIVGGYFEFTSYNPGGIGKMEEKVIEVGNNITGLDTLIRLGREISEDNFITKERLLNASGSIFGEIDGLNNLASSRIALLKNSGLEIQGVSFSTIKSSETFVRNWLKGEFYSITVERLNIEDYKKDYRELVMALEKAKKGKYVYIEYDNSFKEYAVILGDRDYRGIVNWITIIGSAFGILLGTTIFVFVIRGVAYYIILGRFNPEK